MNKPFRGLHYDLARGNYDSIASLRRLVRFVAECGLNELVFYMEDLWRYRRHPQLSNRHAYRLEDMARLAEEAGAQGVDFIPSLTTLGHSQHILRKPKYRSLAFPGKNADFDVLNPAVYELFDDLFDEVLPHFASPYVFINGDEMNLSQLSAAASRVAQRDGLGALYGRGMGRLARMILERRRRPIMWHDMLLHHPESLAHIPRETIVAYWFYDPQPAFPAIPFFLHLGFDVIAAPGLLGHPPDYARHLPNIEQQVKAAATPAASKRGACLGAMTTVWEDTSWEDAALAIYATGRWANDARLARSIVLRNFARDVFGVDARRLGQTWFDASRFCSQIALLQTALAVDPAPAEARGVTRRLHALTRNLKRHTRALIVRGANRQRLLSRHLRRLAIVMMRHPPPRARPTESAMALFSPALVDSGDLACRLIETRTSYNHRLLVLSNGLIALAILPEFGAALIEWVTLGAKPWSVVLSNYVAWAGQQRRAPGDPGLGSPWGAAGIGGWRENIFYNSRLNPCSLWGRPFTARTITRTTGLLELECVGRNEVAEVRRTISLARGQRNVAIDIQAVNRIGACHLALQVNGCHHFPGSTAALLRLTEQSGGRRHGRYLLDHGGAKRFTPTGNLVRIHSPVSRRYLQVRFQPEEIEEFLTDAWATGFTLEPLGTIRRTRRGGVTRLRLNYEFGRET